MMQRAIVLFAHGSRDPSWSAPIEAVARRMRQTDPSVEVRCAYLELMEPALAQAVRELAAAGTTQVRIVPMFLGVGRHAREDLPRLVAELRRDLPAVRLELTPPVGEDPRTIDTLARVASG